MTLPLDFLDQRLLGEWQRDFPLAPAPFAEIAGALDLTEAEVLTRLSRLCATGAVSRVGATIRPNTAGASTLAAIAAPDRRVDEVAAVIGAEPGVNHAYLREGDWNIWFVATGPDRAHVGDVLARVRAATGLTVLDLPLVRPYHIDLGFGLDGRRQASTAAAPADPVVLDASDRALLQALSQGLALVPRPFARLAAELELAEEEVIERIKALTAAGIVSRFGVILRHRALGWRANAMVVWRLPEGEVDRAGRALAAVEGVTLCYHRRPDPLHWPYNLYCMIHARSRDEALAILTRAADAARIGGVPHRILFSLRCFKQTGAMLLTEGKGGRRVRRPVPQLDATDRRIVNALQAGFPLTPRPYAEAAAALGLTEDDLIARLKRLLEIGALTRFGPFFDAAAMGGAFCLCAMAVPEEAFEAVMTQVNAHAEVAHNYQRTHRLNMWFVLATETPEGIEQAAREIECETGLAVLRFPKEREFYVGFRVAA